ncbi:hypothetical protein ABIB27_003812 [Arthrobacter sp. UYEF21]
MVSLRLSTLAARRVTRRRHPRAGDAGSTAPRSALQGGEVLSAVTLAVHARIPVSMLRRMICA